MLDRFFKMHYFDTYFFINVIHALVTDQSPFPNTLEHFLREGEHSKFLEPFPKYCALHKFIKFLIITDMYESIDDVVHDAIVFDPDFNLWVDLALAQYGIDHEGFRSWIKGKGIDLEDCTQENLREYHEYLEAKGIVNLLLAYMVDEIFFILFLNRELLAEFNGKIAELISLCKKDAINDDDQKYFKDDGGLNRTYIPVWATRAVFYRDRGRCSSCQRDISGLVSINSNEHFDHIVPLATGGINDVTNIQLLCQECNLKKGPTLSPPSITYERWYEMDE